MCQIKFFNSFPPTSSAFFCFMLRDSIWTVLNNFDNFFSVLKCDKSFPPGRRILAIGACDLHFFLLASSCFPNGLQSCGSAINFYFPFRDIFSLNFALEICCHLCALLKTIESSLILSFILQWAMRALTNSSNSSFSSSIYGHPLHHPPRQKSICWWPWHWTCGRSGNQKEANGGWKWYQGKGFGTNFKYFLAIGESQQV